MPTFYFHLRDGIDQLLDPDGVECVDLEAVKARTLTTARDLIAHDARDGEIDLRYRIDVGDVSGATVHMLTFENAVTIRRAAD